MNTEGLLLLDETKAPVFLTVPEGMRTVLVRELAEVGTRHALISATGPADPDARFRKLALIRDVCLNTQRFVRFSPTKTYGRVLTLACARHFIRSYTKVGPPLPVDIISFKKIEVHKILAAARRARSIVCKEPIMQVSETSARELFR